MNDGKPWLKWGCVIVPIIAAGFAIWPPQQKLKGGIDLVGGTSLLFEIDTTGLSGSEQRGLAEKVMTILKKRVDPNGQLNLVWRPIGSNRLEIQMPRPTQEALQRRAAYESSITLIRGLNITRNDVESALNVPADQVDARLAELVRTHPDTDARLLTASLPDDPPGQRAAVEKALTQGIPERRSKLQECKARFESYRQAREGDDPAAAEIALADFDKAVDAALNTNLDPARLEDLLALEREGDRTKELDQLRTKYPAYAPLIDHALAMHDQWSSRKGELEDPSDLKRRIRGAGVLEFRILAERDPSTQTMTYSAKQPHLRQRIADYAQQLQERGPRPKPGDSYQWFPVPDVVGFLNLARIEDFDKQKDRGKIIVERYAGNYFVLTHADPGMGLLAGTDRPWKLREANPTRNSETGLPAVNFLLDARGGSLFAELTGANIDRPMAIMLDDNAQSFANIASRISESGIISGPSFTAQDVNDLVTTLEAGSLPARLKETPLMEKNIGPSLGERNRTMGMRAAIGGLISTIAFMLIYYRFSGVLASLALLMNLLLTLAVMAALEATFTLPGIAGLILSVGMAVDANVLINERIREEREKGTPMKKAIRQGYDKAFTAIFDSNLTTLISCVILGYVGSEEVKGFALVLGCGIVTSIFTAVFVTKLILTTLQEQGWIHELRMMKLISVPSIDWMGLRRWFWPMSLGMVALGFGAFALTSAVEPDAVYDIEFLGGTAVQIELKPGEKMNDDEVRRRVSSLDTSEQEIGAAGWLLSAADELESRLTVEAAGPQSYRVTAPKLTAEQLAALMRGSLADALDRDGLTGSGKTAEVRLKPESGMDEAGLRVRLKAAAEAARSASKKLAAARVQTVEDITVGQEPVSAFEIVTVETNRDVVQTAIVAAIGDKLQIQRPVNYEIIRDPRAAPDGYFPIEDDDRFLDDVLEGVIADVHYDIQRYKGGVALVFDKLDPPQSESELGRRIREIRLQPEFEDFKWRDYLVKGLVEDVAGGASGADVGKEPRYRKVALLVVDESAPYGDDPGRWEEVLAKPELRQAEEALRSQKSLQKVIQFAPQVAGQTRNQAFMALVLALVGIVAYVWIRFGSMQYGLAAIVAAVHDVGFTLGILTFGHYVWQYPWARWLGIVDFKIDMPIVAAVLTVVGYSINDTIVIFDRIREHRGKVQALTPQVINGAINQTLSRTLLTGTTTLLSLLIMYVLGGEGVHGFAYAMFGGTIIGTYSSFGIAAPLIYRPRVLNIVVYILIALAAVGVFSLMSTTQAFLLGAVAVIAAALAWAIGWELQRHGGPGLGRPATA